MYPAGLKLLSEVVWAKFLPCEEEVGCHLTVSVNDKAVHISRDATSLTQRELIIPCPVGGCNLRDL